MSLNKLANTNMSPNFIICKLLSVMSFSPIDKIKLQNAMHIHNNSRKCEKQSSNIVQIKLKSSQTLNNGV